MSEARTINPPNPPRPPPMEKSSVTGSSSAPPPVSPPAPLPEAPPSTKENSRRRPKLFSCKADTTIAFGILILTGVLVLLTWLLLVHESVRALGPSIETRIIDPMVPANDVRVVVRPPDGTPAKDFQVKPLGQTPKSTDAYGECFFDGTSRGCSADLFDASGKFLSTIILPSAGHLEVKVHTLSPAKG